MVMGQNKYHIVHVLEVGDVSLQVKEPQLPSLESGLVNDFE